jgi:hypothetical protein
MNGWLQDSLALLEMRCWNTESATFQKYSSPAVESMEPAVIMEQLKTL